MNELERQIRDLSLSKPGSSMDERVFSLLQGSSDVASREQSHSEHASPGMMESRTAKTSLANGTSQARRGIFSATFAGLATALLIGIAVGNMMPSLWSAAQRSTMGNNSPADTENMTVPEDKIASEIRTRHPMLPDLPVHVRDALKIEPTVGSQFVESSYQSAITGAALWQQQNREIFNVATHVSDRRFDMCRDCHRVGG